MMYLSGAWGDLAERRLPASCGIMANPATRVPLPRVWRERTWAADNGCFSGAWRSAAWLAWLTRLTSDVDRCLFAVAPDVVCDWGKTLQLWRTWHETVRRLGYAVALVAQDGATEDTVPWECVGALFIGGSTTWKLSAAACRLMQAAKARGKWLHVGRVNSYRRIEFAERNAADSVDGTYIRFGPSKNIEIVRSWMTRPRNGWLF